jgi:hypothetical protein
MIVLHISADGVKKAFVHADSESAEDAALAIWPVVRNEIKRLDKRLRAAAEKRLAVDEERQP